MNKEELIAWIENYLERIRELDIEDANVTYSKWAFSEKHKIESFNVEIVRKEMLA